MFTFLIIIIILSENLFSIVAPPKWIFIHHSTYIFIHFLFTFHLHCSAYNDVKNLIFWVFNISLQHSVYTLPKHWKRGENHIVHIWFLIKYQNAFFCINIICTTFSIATNSYYDLLIHFLSNIIYVVFVIVFFWWFFEIKKKHKYFIENSMNVHNTFRYKRDDC